MKIGPGLRQGRIQSPHSAPHHVSKSLATRLLGIGVATAVSTRAISSSSSAFTVTVLAPITQSAINAAAIAVAAGPSPITSISYTRSIVTRSAILVFLKSTLPLPHSELEERFSPEITSYGQAYQGDRSTEHPSLLCRTFATQKLQPARGARELGRV
jgi:hypothetical protein